MLLQQFPSPYSFPNAMIGASAIPEFRHPLLPCFASRSSESRGLPLCAETLPLGYHSVKLNLPNWSGSYVDSSTTYCPLSSTQFSDIIRSAEYRPNLHYYSSNNLLLPAPE